MRAVLIKGDKGPAENLYIGDAPTPSAQSCQVLVKVKAFGLNRADVSQRMGNYPPPAGASSILGVEFAGIIEQLGPDVSSWKVGDEVIGLVGGGAYAEYINCYETNLMPKPSHLSWVEAATVAENFLTAFQALIFIADLKEGENVMIHAGASGVGIAAIQIARMYKAATVIATASSDEKLKTLLNAPMGATHAVNYKTQDFAAEVQKVTEGKGVNVIIDFVAQSHWTKNIDSLSVDGRMIMLAVLSGPVVHEANLAPILYKRLRIQGSTLRSRSLNYQAQLISRFNKEILPHITSREGNGPLRLYIHSVYPWTEIVAAHQEMEGNATIGKLIAEIS